MTAFLRGQKVPLHLRDDVVIVELADSSVADDLITTEVVDKEKADEGTLVVAIPPFVDRKFSASGVVDPAACETSTTVNRAGIREAKQGEGEEYPEGITVLLQISRCGPREFTET